MSAQPSIEMASAFKSPDPKKTLSARVRRSIHGKISALVEIWKAKLVADGKIEEAKEVDPTFVVDALLAKATDEELAEWGGWPDSPAKLETVIKAIGEASKSSKTKH